MRTLPLTIPLTLTTAFLPAQALVSPASVATTEGNYDNGLPLGYLTSLHTYLQVHQDLKGRSGTFTRMALRRDGTLATNASYVAKTITMSLWFGPAVDIGGMSAVFASNFTATPTLVANNKTYNLPDWTAQPAPAPAAFTFLCALDAPYVWTGTQPFAWLARVHGMDSAHAVFADAVRTQMSATGGETVFGTGCTATGATSPYLASATYQHTGTAYNAFWSCSNGVPNATVAIVLGTQAGNVPIAGLCAPILVTPLVFVYATAPANGNLVITPSPFPTNPAFAGAHIFMQCACVDTARANPIKVTMSNGSDATIPPPVAPPVARVYNAGTDTASSGFLDPSSIRLGSVIRLD